MELLSIFVEKFSLLNLPKCDEKDKKKKKKREENYDIDPTKEREFDAKD